MEVHTKIKLSFLSVEQKIWCFQLFIIYKWCTIHQWFITEKQSTTINTFEITHSQNPGNLSKLQNHLLDEMQQYLACYVGLKLWTNNNESHIKSLLNQGKLQA